ncbi:MAG: permease-like cell division protein FtsX [Vampirovibrionales bacterium]|nr:permease-like cell division protein FtsX [Vampirovibrionales bacterium]
MRANPLAPVTGTAELLATELRIASRLLLETLGGLKRSSWMNLVIVITLGSILTIFGSMAAFVLNIQQLIRNVGSGVEISVYVDPPNANPMFSSAENTSRENQMVQNLMKTIEAYPAVKQVEFLSRQQAWDVMRKQYDAVDIDNPLPNTLHVKVKDASLLESTVDELSRLPNVIKVNYAKNVVEKLKQLASAVSAIGVILTTILALLTMFIISNTIHLLIEARSREIEILRMMGVGNWYIRLPFFFQGALYGVCAVAVAMVPLMLVQHYSGQLFGYFQAVVPGSTVPLVATLMLLLSLGVGVGGAAVSTHRFLRI